MYYDRKGNPLTLGEWSSLKESGESNKVAQTHIEGYVISTIWLGLDHQYGDGPPLIFETMVFPTGPDNTVSDWGDLDCDRYSTEEEALEGHKQMVEKWKNHEEA